MFDPAAGDTADPLTASLAVWFDGFVLNVDRTPRNPNLLRWHRELYFIDHGAALYFHHNWPTWERLIESPFPAIRDHLLLPWAIAVEEAAATAKSRLNSAVFAEILGQVPDAWLTPEPAIPEEATVVPTADQARAILGAAPSVRLEEFPSPGKAAGEDVVSSAPEEPKPTKAPDLMAALEESLASIKGEEKETKVKASGNGAKAATSTPDRRRRAMSARRWPRTRWR